MSLTASQSARPGAGLSGWRAGCPPWPFSGGEAGALVRLAAPIVMIALVNMGMSVTDTVMVSWFFGTEALAAVAVGSDLYSIAFYLGAGIIAGLSPFVADAVARNSTADQDKYRRVGWVVAGATAVFLFPLIWFAPDTLGIAGLDRQILDAGRGYTKAMAFTLVPMLVVVLFRTLLTAAERPKVFLWVTLAVLPLNALANGLLMNGLAGIPGFGPTGAGISSFVVASVMTIALVVILHRDTHSADRRRQPRIPIDWRAVADVVRVGIPIGIATVTELGIFLGATLYAATLSAADVAAHTVTLRLAGIFYAVPLALMQASAVRMARVEPDDIHGTRTVIATVATVAVLCGVFLAVSLAALAPGIAGLAFDHTETGLAAAGLAFGLIILLGFTELVEAPASAVSGLLRGRKDTKVPMVYVLAGYWGISAPLGLFLSKSWEMGITGVWIALAVGILVVAVLNTLRLTRYWRPGSASLSA